MIFHDIRVNFFASTLLALYFYLSLIPAIFFFHQVEGKPVKFINNESFQNESKLTRFLSLYEIMLGHRLGKYPNNFCINININVY